MSIKFFGEVDIHPTKKVISSEYPAWYQERQLEQLEEEVAQRERQLDRGEITPDKLGEFREALSKRRETRDKIKSSIPKLTGAEKDNLAKVRKEMENIIREGYFTRSQMVKGTVDAHKEAMRMIKPMVEVKPEFAGILEGCNIKSKDGKVSRDEIVKAWKITGKLLNYYGGDEETNAEVLRKD